MTSVRPHDVGSPGRGFSPATDSVAGEIAQDHRHYVYVVSRGGKAQADDMFAAMRRDMSIATVEVIYDRRVGERRSPGGDIDQDRRKSDRRHIDVSTGIAAAGWVRIEPY